METDKNEIKINIERDIIKSYRSKLWAKFIKALKEFNMIEPHDKVAVAVSGGKDSLVLAKLLQEVQRHGDMDFDLEFIAMDPGFSEANRVLLEKNCALLGIPVKIYPSNVFEVAYKLNKDNPCYMCARMRRGFLYRTAKELGCNKLALGHHFDDVIETTIMNILYSGCFKTMVPKIKSKNYSDITLIRPLYFIYEKDIRALMKRNNIFTMTCGCKVATNEIVSKRKTTKDLIETLQKENPLIRKNIFASNFNVNINAILGYKSGDDYIDFNEIFKINEGSENDD